MQRNFFVLEILDKQAFNGAPFNPVILISITYPVTSTIEVYNHLFVTSIVFQH